MAANRIPSRRYEGVYHRESLTRTHRGRPDRTFSYTLRESGKKKYINVGRASEGFTEEMAYQLRLEALNKIHKGETVDTFSDKKSKTFDNIVTAYFNWKKAEGKHTIEDISRYNNHIKPALGSLPVSYITLERLDKLKAEKQKILSQSSVKKLFILMRAAINHAIVRKLYSGMNPVAKQTGFIAPREDNRAERFLTKDEAHILLKELEMRSTQLYHMAFAALYTGMRATEIFGLKGADIDENNSIAVITAKGGEREVIHLRHEVLSILKQYCTRPDALLFSDGNGNRFQDVPDTFGRAVNALGFNDCISDNRHKVWFHTLRHTFASWLAQSGKVTLLELKEAMRHKRIETTLRYAHLVPGEQRKKLSILDNFMPQ